MLKQMFVGIGNRPVNKPKAYGTDRVGFVGFHDEAFVIAKPAEPHAYWLQERAQNMQGLVGGSYTNLTAGLRTATTLLRNAPYGVLRRTWLLTDGYPNRETSELMNAVEEARKNYINVNCIGFGDSFDEKLLGRIASATHNGKFVSVASLSQLTNALVASGGQTGPRHHRSETTVIAIDLSLSMNEAMGGRSKIQTVEQALLQLLLYKQRCFA